MARTSASDPSQLQGCYVISLRPVGGHAALRRAAARHGARVLALSPWRLETNLQVNTGAIDTARARAKPSASLRADLRAALQAGCIIVTSPAAVAAARSLQSLRCRRGQRWIAVGTGTAIALRRAGIPEVIVPVRMDSEGILALPDLCDVRGADIGLLGAPGGRDRIAPTLRHRGARVLRADVYVRIPVALATRSIDALRALPRSSWLALSSGEALQSVLAQLPADAARHLRTMHVVAASDRLAALAQAAGFKRVHVAGNARPATLVATAAGQPVRAGQRAIR